jgi:hypothetical protein
LKVEIGTMLRATERGLKGYRAELDKETVRDLEDAMQAARKACEQVDVNVLQKSRDVFERATLPLAAVMMDSVAKQALSGKRLDEV